MVDVHCHILPEVDDGAKSWDVALEMCRLAVQDGITHIVATPHANNEYSYRREAHERKLQELRERAPDSLQFSLGCDFHFSYENVEDALVHPERYAISGTSYMLIELSDYSIPPSLGANMSKLNAAGLTLILTHPERNAILQHRPEQVIDWADQGCIVQVTASSVTGFWGKIARKVARWLIEHDAVHVLATDAHDAMHRPPILSEAGKVVADWTNADVAKALVEENPRAIVTGQELPYFPSPTR
jgi:protein-tyrosine phosphatase